MLLTSEPATAAGMRGLGSVHAKARVATAAPKVRPSNLYMREQNDPSTQPYAQRSRDPQTPTYDEVMLSLRKVAM